MVQGLLPLSPSVTMMAATPDGLPPGGSVTFQSKNSLPAVPRRDPEAGVLRVEDDFSWFWGELNRFMSVSLFYTFSLSCMEIHELILQSDSLSCMRDNR
jgi:hypothetical protein